MSDIKRYAKLNEAFQYVSDEFLDIVELEKKNRKKRPIWVVAATAAACICLMLVVPVGVMAYNWFGLRDLLVPGWINEHDMIALSGYRESPEVKALIEWNEFLAHYDTDHKILDELGNNVFTAEGRDDWLMYYVYSYEMGEKLDEIADKYDLKLHTEMNLIDQDELMYRVGGSFIDKEYLTWAYIYENGSFHVEGDVELAGCGMAAFQFNRAVKGTFEEAELNIGQPEDYMEWQYLTACEEPVLLGLGPHKALIFADFKECFIAVNVLLGSDDGMTKEDLQKLADKIDFGILKDVRVPEMRGDSKDEDQSDTENHDNTVSQEQWLPVTDQSIDEGDLSDKIDVIIIEPVRTFDQTASYEESQNVLNMISHLSADDFEAAVTYDKNSEKPFSDDHVVLLCQSETGNASVYGYESNDYDSRGIILYYNDGYSYFDCQWERDRGEMKVYEQDLDHDGIMEVAFSLLGAYGTGIYIERLIVFDDIEGSGTYMAYEFTPEMQLEEFQNDVRFIINTEGKELIIRKSDQTERTIAWEYYRDEAINNVLEVDCLNLIEFEIEEDIIKMYSDIALYNGGIGASMFCWEEVCFDIIYSDGSFQVK